MRSPRHQSRRHTPLKKTTIIVLGVAGFLITTVAAVTALGAGFAMSLADTFERNTTTLESPFPQGGRPAPSETGALNILLMGSDSRGDAATVGEGGTSNQRSDVLMLVHIDGARQRMTTMSIMRDTWVEIPGHGPAKINAAFAWGGTPLTVATVENLLDIRIDHVALIDFQGFENMTDALGGVDVDVTRPFEREGFSYHAGTNHLDGPQALGFVRERYAFTEGDYQRVVNQQLFLQSIADKAFSRSTLTDPTKLSSFVAATTEHLSVDSGLDLSKVVSIGLSLRNLHREDIRFFTLPAGGSGTSEDGQQYITLDGAALAEVKAALAADTIFGR